MPLESLYDLSFKTLQSRLLSDGVRPIHAVQLWKLLYYELEPDPNTSDMLSPPLRRWLKAALEESLTLSQPSVCDRLDSSDGLTKKLLLRLHDGQEIETVVMGYPGRFTACISSQAGCAMGCVFCATGQMGFVRHLSHGEIVTQVMEAQRLLRAEGNKLRNLVLMGMGEPLHNYDVVMEALASVCHLPGIGIAPSRISVSTVGLVPGIIRFTEERLPYSLAISLHAATDAERSALLPVNQRWPLSELMEACRYYSRKLQRKVFFGWTLIAGQNDSADHALVLLELLQGLDAHVNLIRLNRTAGFSGRTSEEPSTTAFQKAIQEAGVPCTVRQYRGIDVAAGCGQLRADRQKFKSPEIECPPNKASAVS
ncbi:MAG: 23S rRNA (adenine2503-C2)-methyltransferase [Verrucomicrobia bacterium]|nr:MAG: 23S rRNA (adenine2503-C2)-methyltransferase [Verrucomicrobiota bacterium]